MEDIEDYKNDEVVVEDIENVESDKAIVEDIEDIEDDENDDCCFATSRCEAPMKLFY
jgi:hypothetical protein